MIPSELIAQTPTRERGLSRLLVLTRSTQQLAHRRFEDLVDYLRAGDLLVLNNSRVLRARLWGKKNSGSAKVETLLVEEIRTNEWWSLMRPGKRLRIGTRIDLQDLDGAMTSIRANVAEKNPEGHFRLEFSGTTDIKNELDRLGEIPLPPYITRRPTAGKLNDYERYQTVYAGAPGSVAAPTAGLHFTDQHLSRLSSQGVRIRHLTLHVGLGTFAPVKTEAIDRHVMHEEMFELDSDTAKVIDETRESGGRIVAVGTTTARVLETVAAANAGRMSAARGRTRIFIYPPYPFQATDALITNFHLPRSTLLMLVSAFAAPNETRGVEIMRSAYAEAIRLRYRFYSYGDAMLIQ